VWNGYYNFSKFDTVFLDTKDVITRPDPIPIKMDATNNRTDVLRNIDQTPTPITVAPPIHHESLSFLYPYPILLYCLKFKPTLTDYCYIA
jgi:hypothetical protein